LLKLSDKLYDERMDDNLDAHDDWNRGSQPNQASPTADRGEYKHRRQEPFFVARKTITKPSIFVKFVIKFEGAANPTHNLSLCSPHNRNWQG
jgi:hypothetical protein